MMRLGLSSAAFYGMMETEESAAHLKMLPLDFCEIFLETRSEYSAAFGREVRSALSGLDCLAIHSKSNQYEGDLFGASARQRRDAFESFSGVLDCGHELGAHILVFHGPPDVRGGLRPGRVPRLRETAAELVAQAAEQGIQLAWENVSWCALKRPEDAAFLREACPGLRFVLDIKQAYQAGEDPLDYLPVFGEKLCHVHVLDWDEAGSLCLPGQGVFDFPRLKRALENIGYQGDILLEPYAAQAADEGALLQSLAYLRGVFC
jgi:sugar phosphate isomerase/epimerase